MFVLQRRRVIQMYMYILMYNCICNVFLFLIYSSMLIWPIMLIFWKLFNTKKLPMIGFKLNLTGLLNNAELYMLHAQCFIANVNFHTAVTWKINSYHPTLWSFRISPTTFSFIVVVLQPQHVCDLVVSFPTAKIAYCCFKRYHVAS